jgi:Spy/CpxP family protein refolding chaperone
MKTIILAIAMIFSSIGTFAQGEKTQNKERKSVDERATRATRMMTANLQLNQEQSSKIVPVLKEREIAKDLAREKHANDKAAKKAAIKAAHDKADESLKTILTPEQFTKLLALREEQKQKNKDRKTGDSKDINKSSAEDEDFY